MRWLVFDVIDVITPVHHRLQIPLAVGGCELVLKVGLRGVKRVFLSVPATPPAFTSPYLYHKRVSLYSLASPSAVDCGGLLLATMLMWGLVGVFHGPGHPWT